MRTTTHRRTAAIAIGALATTLLAAGCSSNEPTAAAPEPTPAVTAATSASTMQPRLTVDTDGEAHIEWRATRGEHSRGIDTGDFLSLSDQQVADLLVGDGDGYVPTLIPLGEGEYFLAGTGQTPLTDDGFLSWVVAGTASGSDERIDRVQSALEACNSTPMSSFGHLVGTVARTSAGEWRALGFEDSTTTYSTRDEAVQHLAAQGFIRTPWDLSGKGVTPIS